MALESIRLVTRFAVPPETLYRAWLDGAEHGKMTGAEATCEPLEGTRHTAWEGYIEGENLALEPHRRIVQSWRTTEFADDDVDSRLTLTLRALDGGTELTLEHVDIPAGQGADYETGWESHYFTPMRAYFATLTGGAKSGRTKKAQAKSAGAKKATAKSAGAKKATAKSAGAKKAPAKRAAPAKKAASAAKAASSEAKTSAKRSGARKA